MDTKKKTIDQYISEQPPHIGARITQMRAIFHTVFPDVQETFSYGMPAFILGKQRLYVGAYDDYLGFYPMYGLAELEEQLAKYRGKGTKHALHLPHNAPLPVELIKKIIIAKAKQ